MTTRDESRSSGRQLAAGGDPFANRLTLRIREVAAWTGLSQSGVRKLIREGKLRTTRPLDAVLIYREDVLRILKQHELNQVSRAARLARELSSALARTKR